MRTRYFVSVVLIGLVAGCGKTGPDTAPVSGRITLDGNPIENTDVTFESTGSRMQSSGHTDKDGHYELIYKRGVVGGMIGENTVRISTNSEVVKGANKFHENYNVKSGLKREVKSGNNTIDFDLKSDGSTK